MDQLHQLRGQIKEQAAKIKELQRENKRLREPPKVAKVHEPKEKPLPTNGKHTLLSSIYKCPDCGGSLKNIELGIRTITHCISCGYKKAHKNG